MVEDTAACANEELDTTAKRISLTINAHSTIDCESIVLTWSVLEGSQDILHLDSKFASGRHDDGLDAPRSQELVLTHPLCDRNAEGQGLSTACQVTCNDILSVEDGIEAVLLDREERLDASRDKLLGRLLMDFWEARKLSILHSVLFQPLRSRFFSCKARVIRKITTTIVASLALFGWVHGSSS